jgi:hypothetical protein
LLLLVGYWGCAGDLQNPERFGFLLDGATKENANQGEIPAPPECLTSLFEARCGTTGCHAKDSPQIDLVSPGVADRLVDKSSTSSMCKDRPFVPTDGEESLLLRKLEVGPPCGLRMPLGEPLVAADMACVSGWVKAVSDANGGGN